MESRFTDNLHERWRFAGLALAAVLIVVVPTVLQRKLAREAVDAAQWVAHTHEVGARLYNLQADIRDVESAALTLSKGIDTPALRERMRQADQIHANVDELARLVSDNQEQLLRMGRMDSLLERRMSLAKQVAGSAASDPQQQRQLIEEMTFHYPIRGIVRELQGHEESVLAERVAQAEWQKRQSALVTWTALVAQLLLLALVMWLLRRQIGGRTRAEQRLLRESARARAVLQTVREPIVLLDGAQQVVLHNAAFAELYGEGASALDGRPLAEVGGGVWADAIILQRLADVLLRGRELWDYEHEQRGSDERIRIMLINARRMPLPDSDDEVVLMTVSDVTLQRAVQLRVEELNRQLEGKVEQMAEVNRELEAFSYSVSHDLRAPLRHVAGFADKLDRYLGEGADEKARHYLQIIGDSARRMSLLIDDLLVYSRLGRGAMRLQAVDMQSLVEETRAMLDANLRNDAGDGPAREIEWKIAPLPVLVADENMMRQLWLNLLGNAVKYTAGRDPAVIEVSVRELADGTREFTVRDNGAGFDMQYAGKLFGVFQRLHKASDYPGTGIGLASVRRVLTRHGGRIRAEAEPGKGAAFHFTLPPPAPGAPNTGSST